MLFFITLHKGGGKMKNKYYSSNASLLIPFFVFSLVFVFFSCDDNIISTEVEKPQTNLPEFLIEDGTDLDSSYFSLRGLIKSEDTLEIQATRWGIVETGLFLYQKDLGDEIQYEILGMCGTVSSITWKKVTLKSWITRERLKTLKKLSCTRFIDTISYTIPPF